MSIKADLAYSPHGAGPVGAWTAWWATYINRGSSSKGVFAWTICMYVCLSQKARDQSIFHVRSPHALHTYDVVNHGTPPTQQARRYANMSSSFTYLSRPSHEDIGRVGAGVAHVGGVPWIAAVIVPARPTASFRTRHPLRAGLADAVVSRGVAVPQVEKVFPVQFRLGVLKGKHMSAPQMERIAGIGIA